MFENSQNSLLAAVIQTSIRIRTLNSRMKEQALAEKGEMVLEAISKADAGRTFELFLEAMIKLQTDVNAFMDSNRNTAPVRQGKLPPPGIKQVLEKKEGLFRKHMMVSFSLLGPYNADGIGKTSQLRRPFRYFARYQYRDRRNRSSTRLCSEAHLPRASDCSQHPRNETTRHQWSKSTPRCGNGPERGRYPDLPGAYSIFLVNADIADMDRTGLRWNNELLSPTNC